MSLWTDIRDTAEGGAALLGNYLAPGSELLTGQLVSKGAQKMLSSPVGVVAGLGTGLAGAGIGSDITGIPSAANIGAGWGNIGNAVGIGGGATPATGSAGGGLSSFSGNAPIYSSPSGYTPDIAPSTGGAPAGLGDTGAGVATDPNALTPEQVASGQGAAPANVPAPPVPKATPGYLDRAMSAIKANPLQAAALGLQGMNLMGAKPTPTDPRMASLSADAQALSHQLTQQYQSGTLNPADSFRIAQWADGQKAALKDYYAKAGLSDSSMAVQAMGQVDAQAQAMRDQAMQSVLKGATGALSAAAPIVGNEVQQQISNDAAYQKQVADFTTALSTLGRAPTQNVAGTPVPQPQG